ncbi:hypothetical protein [Arthrobacter sp. L77]|uniref:hypothetical protein n=1 Tax=Arthrobacter sp. L77 TaxID=1496689 RepID=UPI0005BA5A26|nr:hypothetical protein [Arthrobacter sp. L77]
MGRPATVLLSSGAVCLALLLSSCAPPEAGADADTAETQDAPSAPGTTPAATPASTDPPSGSPSTAPPDADPGWATYTTPDGGLSFDHPGDWTVVVSTPAPPEGVAVAVEDGAGRRLASLRTDLVTGAVCPAKVPYSLLDSEPLPALTQASGTPMFVFEGRTDPAVADPVAASTLAYGITSGPLPEGTTACPIAHFFTWPPSGAAFGGVYDPYEIYPGKPMHIDTPQAYMETEEYQRIRTMLTSLRPAG